MVSIYFNDTLSLKEKGLLMLLTMSISAGDEPTIQDLVRFNSDGKSSITHAMNGLIEKGYVDRDTIRESGRIVGVKYSVRGM